MKKCLLSFIVVLVITKIGYSQSMTKTQAEYFILGTLNDYMGRSLDPREKNLVDRYDRLQGPVVDALEPVIKSIYPNVSYKAERYKDKDGQPLSYKIYSDTLARVLNSYYLFSAAKHWTDTGEEILSGRLNADKIKTEEQQLAFLAGVYARFGVPCDTAYHISIANSVSKARLCTQLLAGLNSEPYYQIMRDFIPNGHHVYFHPSAKVKAYLAKYSLAINTRLEATQKHFIDSLSAKYDTKQHDAEMKPATPKNNR